MSHTIIDLVMAKAHIEHLVWTNNFEAREVNCIYEFEIITISVSNQASYIDSTHSNIPFLYRCFNPVEYLLCTSEVDAIIQVKGKDSTSEIF